ncbi:CPA_1a_G0000890.mRNA.1.CDS.1 [Saccharomyces cerevisiae]|nr:CPA_1a_G0000890.mRNA.1.CDS.1 [Saccharomyces cerevisiae]CAI7129580.1 CPA_1a_G0000890.mRNA.1.CDS.1 [Saccharomyces cerevisiae]
MIFKERPLEKHVKREDKWPKIMAKPRGRKGAAQPRASQNAFRKRKLERLKELEKKEAQLTVTNDQIHILKKEMNFSILC